MPADREGMSDKPPRRSRRLRSTLDRVLVHDIKNMGFRLQLLLSNLEENYGDPEFKRSVEDLLRSTVERIDGIVERFSAHDEPVLIKVAVDLNGIIREVAEGETRRGLSVPPALPGTRTSPPSASTSRTTTASRATPTRTVPSPRPPAGSAPAA